MSINSLFFGGLAVIGILIFFYLGRFRAGASQRNREDKIRWKALIHRKSNRRQE